MLKKRITDRAKNHLADVKRFTVSQWGQEQAVKYLREIYDKIDLLAQRPQIGVNRTEELGDGIHSCFIGSHTIYYKHDKKNIVIHAILHQSMTPYSHMRSPQK